jgi:hypothetical protein
MTQEYDKFSIRVILPVAAAFWLFGAIFPVAAHPFTAPDSILNGPPAEPCVAVLAGPSYVPGVDATGAPVVPAEGESAHPGLASKRVEVAVPRGNGGEVMAEVDLAGLAPPSCTGKHAARHRG